MRNRKRLRNSQEAESVSPPTVTSKLYLRHRTPDLTLDYHMTANAMELNLLVLAVDEGEG